MFEKFGSMSQSFAKSDFWSFNQSCCSVSLLESSFNKQKMDKLVITQNAVCLVESCKDN